VPFNSITAKRFTGQYHETALPGGEGLSFYNARWYDPKLGSFLSADSIVPQPLDPQSLNRYAYAGGNPLRFSDPSGHTKLCGAACEDEYKWSPVKTVGGSSGSTGGGTYGDGASVGRGTISYRHPAAGDYGLASYKMSQQPTRSVTASTVTQHPLYGTARLALGNMVYLEEGPGGSWRSRTAAAYVAWNTAGYDILVLLNNELRPGRYAYQGPWMPEGADPEIWNDILGIVADVLKRRAPDETNGAKYFANIVNTPGEVTRYEDTLAYWVQTNLDANLSRGEALARAGYGLIPRGFGSPYVFVLNRATSVPVPAYRVPDDQYHAPLDVKLD
jgi:RHS repeat-associated protein